MLLLHLKFKPPPFRPILGGVFMQKIRKIQSIDCSKTQKSSLATFCWETFFQKKLFDSILSPYAAVTSYIKIRNDKNLILSHFLPKNFKTKFIQKSHFVQF